MFRTSKSHAIKNRDYAPAARRSSSRGFVAAFALEPRVAFLMFVVDSMVFGGDALTLGALIPIGIVVGGVLGFIVYKVQRTWCKDDHENALIKALVVGLLTAIPAPLGPLFAIPSGLLGIVNSMRRR